ncbi:hypothetical protein RND71_018288 [Anisodus tanguticus]|uniref:Uncharacterized protein n=1 Tax=Anisodus tanguticus TaxID=243964 RepID=A0AAE1S5B8_9SOLA|nr:hypothetical protein RND71_018288 [Anisodus tanguticus]
MGSALETLCGQAYGAGQTHMLGVYMQRTIIILLATCVILLPIYLFANPVLVLLGQETAIAELSGRYTMLLIPQLFSLAINFPTSKFLQAHSKVDVLAGIGFAALLIWYMMSIILLVGHLNNVVIAVGSISICVRVSNELGLGNPRSTKYSVYIAVFQSLLIGILCMVIVLVARNHLDIIFSSSTEMQEVVANLAYLLGITMVLNSVQPVISGKEVKYQS